MAEKKIMFDVINNEYSYALPTSFSELKLLVDTGYCVMDKKDIDFFDFYKDADFIDFDEMTEDDLIEIFDIYISEVTQNEIIKAENAIGLEKEYQAHYQQYQ